MVVCYLYLLNLRMDCAKTPSMAGFMSIPSARRWHFRLLRPTAAPTLLVARMVNSLLAIPRSRRIAFIRVIRAEARAWQSLSCIQDDLKRKSLQLVLASARQRYYSLNYARLFTIFCAFIFFIPMPVTFFELGSTPANEIWRLGFVVGFCFPAAAALVVYIFKIYFLKDKQSSFTNCMILILNLRLPGVIIFVIAATTWLLMKSYTAELFLL
jgi:hypothetical protein